MPPREEELTSAVQDFFRVQEAAVRTAFEAAAQSYAIAELAESPPVDSALEETALLLAALLIEYLPAWYEQGWDEAADQLASAIEMLMRDEADARRRAREIVPVIQTTTQNALGDEARNAAAQAEEEDLHGEEALLLLLLGVSHRYERWGEYRADLIAWTESQSAIGRGGHALASLVAISQAVEKINIDRGDDRVCQNCRANSSEGWIPAAQLFQASGTLVKPHHPRCRCRNQYRIVQ